MEGPMLHVHLRVALKVLAHLRDGLTFFFISPRNRFLPLHAAIRHPQLLNQRERGPNLRCRWRLRHRHGARLGHDGAPHGGPGGGVLARGEHDGGYRAGYKGRGCRWAAGKSIG